ncbi:MAG: hypothetical protein DHS20C16_36050 [Phycisphaerae bacterium]|nr:MAG: hypothetical protein DHS20C16_36050 [Phycisphaerae bacterium]
MIREFDDGAGAVNALCGTLEAHCPDDVVEVLETYRHQSAATPRKVDVNSLRTVLNDLCGSFPRAFVQYNEQDVNGEIAMIWCHCNANERNNCGELGRCEGAPNSPRVTIILDTHEGHPVWIGLRRPPTDSV